jgi:hypothetical protein
LDSLLCLTCLRSRLHKKIIEKSIVISENL